MMTTFFKDNGNVSSVKELLTNGIIITTYKDDPSRGGTTYVGKNAVFRYDKKNRLMCMGIKSGRTSSYFDSDMKYTNKITPF